MQELARNGPPLFHQQNRILELEQMLHKLLFSLFLPLFHAEHVALSDDDELDQRVLKALMEFSVGNHDLPRSDRLSRVFRTECPQVILP